MCSDCGVVSNKIQRVKNPWAMTLQKCRLSNEILSKWHHQHAFAPTQKVSLMPMQQDAATSPITDGGRWLQPELPISSSPPRMLDIMQPGKRTTGCLLNQLGNSCNRDLLNCNNYPYFFALGMVNQQRRQNHSRNLPDSCNRRCALKFKFPTIMRKMDLLLGGTLNIVRHYEV